MRNVNKATTVFVCVLFPLCQSRAARYIITSDPKSIHGRFSDDAVLLVKNEYFTKSRHGEVITRRVYQLYRAPVFQSIR